MNALQLWNLPFRIQRLYIAIRDRNIAFDNLMAQRGHPNALPRYQPIRYRYPRIHIILCAFIYIPTFGLLNLSIPASVIFGIMMWSNCGATFLTCWLVFLNAYVLLRSFAFCTIWFRWPKKIMLISYMRLIFSTIDLICSISGFVLLFSLRSINPLFDENYGNGHFVYDQGFRIYILSFIMVEHIFLFFWWMLFLIMTLRIFYRYGMNSSNLDIAYDSVSKIDCIFWGYGVLLFPYLIKQYKEVKPETRPQIDDEIYTIPANEANMSKTLRQGIETTSHPVVGQLTSNEITNSFQRDEIVNGISRSANRTIDLIPEIRNNPEQASLARTQIENQNFNSIPYPTTRKPTPFCKNLILLLTSPLWIGLTFAGPWFITMGFISNAICGSPMFIWVLIFNIYIILRPSLFLIRLVSKKFSKSASMPIFRSLFFVVDIIFVVTGIFTTALHSDDSSHTNDYASSNNYSSSDFTPPCNDDNTFTTTIMLEVFLTLIYLALIIMMVIRYWYLSGFTHVWKKFHENVYIIDWLALGNGWLIFNVLQDEGTRSRNGVYIIPSSDQASPQILPARVVEYGPNILIPVSPITTNNPHIYNHIGIADGRPLFVPGLPMVGASASLKVMPQNDECAVVERIEIDGTHELNQNFRHHNDLNRQPRTFENNENFQDDEIPCTSQNISGRKNASRGGIIRTNIENISQQPSTSRHGFNNRSNNRRKINENMNEIEMVDLSKFKSNRDMQNFKKQHKEPGDEQINMSHTNNEFDMFPYSDIENITDSDL